MSLAVPVAIPSAPQWAGQIGLVIGAALAILAVIAWLSGDRKMPKGVIPIGLDDAILYLARNSTWGRCQDHSDPMFPARVANALHSALANGDIRARGRFYNAIQGGIADPPLHPKIDIDPGYWIGNPINAWWALSNHMQSAGGAMVRNAMPADVQTHEGRHDIELDRKRLEQIWPRAKN